MPDPPVGYIGEFFAIARIDALLDEKRQHFAFVEQAFHPKALLNPQGRHVEGLGLGNLVP